MNDLILKSKLDALQKTLQSIQNYRHAAVVTMGSAFVIAVMHVQGWVPRTELGWLSLLLILPAFFTWLSLRFSPWKKYDHRAVARLVEARFPELNALLLTAVENLSSAKIEDNIFKQRVMQQIVDLGARQDWITVLTARREKLSKYSFYTGSLAFFIILAVANIWPKEHSPKVALDLPRPPEVMAPQQLSATLTPGDVELERGARLIVEAKFDQYVPSDAILVISEPDGQERERVPMRLTVDDKVFGGIISKVEKDSVYHVEFASGKTKQHRITTFVYPALERADVKITPPSYTGLPVKEIKNTLKVTAMENSELAFTFRINKPVKEAELFAQDKSVLPLKASTSDPTLLTAIMKAEKTQKWRLHLVDEKERANKNPPWISVTVLSNQLAKIEVIFPKRDIQVSALQELPVEAKVWDDLGVIKSGVSFSIAGKSKEVVFKHAATQPAQKQDVKEQLALENENAEPRQLISYHFWAEDKGPRGEERRSMSDMFFADVRHFEDIFREAEPPPSTPGQPEKKTDTDKLVELQKQIVNATWRLIRETNAGRVMDAAAPDVDVVHESQTMALDQTKEVMGKAEDAEIKTALTEAWKSMKDALDPLGQASAEKKRAPLNQALTFEQSALEWLHRAQSREHRVMRQNRPQPSGSASQQAKQNQLMNLELKQQEQRYEEAKQATPEQTAEQQENLQVLNRLKELARRQEALAEKMKELQKQMDKAKTETEKQELADQLKRLQEEQEQILKDVDDLIERLDNSENTGNLTEAKQQLDQTREQVMDAAEKLKEQQLADAANAATRAQRDLEKMQEDFKEKTSRRFTDEMKQVHQQAQEVAEKQKQISEALENQKTGEKSNDTSASLEKMLDGSQVARQIEEQTTQVTELLENMRRISEQAEGNNPLLHRRLYETVRDAQTGGLEENLEEARMQSRYGNRADAQDAERKAAASVEQLQKGVEKAAESVLGSEAEALRMARTELDKLIEEVKTQQTDTVAKSTEDPSGQSASAEKNDSSQNKSQTDPNSQNGKSPQPTDQQGQMAGASPEGQKPGQAKQPGDSNQPGSPAEAESSENKGSAGKGDQPSYQMAQGQGQSSGQPKSMGENNASAPPSSQKQSSQASRSPAAGQNLSGEDHRGGPSSAGGAENSGSFFFDQGTEAVDRSPLTGAGYDQWTDRLRNVEELLNRPELRNEAAKVLDNARAMRIDHQRNDAAPQADNLQMRITEPLLELRNRVAEELAKRDTGNPMVPVDRDPVPPAFRDLVKRYYKELGNGN